jgi:hypothetical protein
VLRFSRCHFACANTLSLLPWRKRGVQVSLLKQMRRLRLPALSAIFIPNVRFAFPYILAQSARHIESSFSPISRLESLVAADLSVVRSTYVSQILVTHPERSSPYTGLVTSTALLGLRDGSYTERWTGGTCATTFRWWWLACGVWVATWCMVSGSCAQFLGVFFFAASVSYVAISYPLLVEEDFGGVRSFVVAPPGGWRRT